MLFIEDIINKFSNCLLTWLIKHTHPLYVSPIYALLWKLPTERARFYVDEIATARKECGGFSQKEYCDWLNTSPECAELRAKIDKLFSEAED